MTTAESRDLLVFSIVRASTCSECNKELWKGDFLFKEGERGLCVNCADLDELVHLPRGDAALTRRARKYSPLWAVVVRFSRARKRYERQGILVSEAALDQAEEECLADSELRTLRRERDAERRAEQDQNLVAEMAREISRLFPGCPPAEARTITEHTARRGSGRVGRTAAGRSLEEAALTLAVVAHIRHSHTRYDQLLMRGYYRTRPALPFAMRSTECWNRGAIPASVICAFPSGGSRKCHRTLLIFGETLERANGVFAGTNRIPPAGCSSGQARLLGRTRQARRERRRLAQDPSPR